MVDGRGSAGSAAPSAERWVSLTEAAEAAGVSRSTLRAWYRDGRLASRLVPGPNGPMREVPLEPVLERARLGERLAAAARPEPSPATGDVDRTAVAALEAALLRAEARADRAEGALRVALQRAARAEAALARGPSAGASA